MDEDGPIRWQKLNMYEERYKDTFQSGELSLDLASSSIRSEMQVK